MASPLPIHCSFNFNPKSKKINLKIDASNTPARDMIIDFGKHKGKMLGSLPSNYLKWVTKNLRAGDSLRWAELSDDVLQDPVYKDRIEWEFAESVLSGNNANRLRVEKPLGDLLEIGERFGWDNEDTIGWAKIDFGLLGTSKGGRIPRVKDRKVEERQRFVSGKREERRESRRVKKMEFLKKEVGIGVGGDDDGGDAKKNPFPGRGALLEKINREGNWD